MAQLCYNCFKEYEASPICPHCGFDTAASAEKSPLALKPGTILDGRYIVSRALGQGGFGISYAAQDYTTKQLVAIKEYMPEDLSSRADGTRVAAFSERYEEAFQYGKAKFLEEAKILSQFNTLDGICDIYSYFEENGTAYFVMEYVDGLNLAEYLDRLGRVLSFDEAKEMLLPLMNTLRQVHAKGIIHRDIAPDNIMVKKDGSLKLIDFGAARYSLGEKTQTLTAMYKPGFAPREQYSRRSHQGPYTDVYALAATVYYTLTGQVPPLSVDRIMEDTLDLNAIPGLNSKDRAVLEKALAVNYTERWQNMDEFVQALQGETKRKAPEKKPEAKARAKRGNTGRAKKPLWLKACALLAAAVIAVPVVRACDDGALTFEELKSEIAWILKSGTRITAGDFGEYGAPGISWNFEKGVLNISGHGDMPDFDADAEQMWQVWYESGICEKTTGIVVEDGIRRIGDHNFEGFEQLESLSLPYGLEEIGNSSFSGCGSLEKINLPQTVHTIGNLAFSRCYSLQEISLPDEMQYIGDHLFLFCDALKTVRLPETLDYMGEKLFDGCNELVSVTIPESLNKLPEDMFDYCDKLRYVYYGGSRERWDEISADNLDYELEEAEIIFAK